MSQQVQEVTSTAELIKLTQANKAVVVKYHAQWCGPCKAFASTFARFARQYGGDITFVEVDIGEFGADDLKQIGVRSVPHFQTYFDGEKQDDVTGAVASKVEHIIEKLDDML